MNKIEMAEICKRSIYKLHADNARKSAILDELVDQAATYCAIQASGFTFNNDWMFNPVAREIADTVVEQACGTIFIADAEDYAEAEARLRNGECWDLLIGTVMK